MIKKVLFLLFLSVFAVSFAAGIMWYSQEILKTDVEEVKDINGYYGSSQGFSGLTQKQEKSPNGALGITVSGTLTAPSVEDLVSALDALSSDIARVSDDELVNVNLDILLGSESVPYNLRYYPTTPGDYEKEQFSEISGLLSEIYDTGFTSYNVEIYPTNSGRYITVTGGNKGIDSAAQTNQPDFVRITTNRLGLNQGDVYDVTYSNASSTDDSFVDYSIQTYYTSAWSFDEALAVDFKMIENYRDDDYLGLISVNYIQGDQPNTKEVVLVVNDSSEEKVNEINKRMTSRVWADNPLPSTYSVSVRAGMNEPNLLTYPSFYVF